MSNGRHNGLITALVLVEAMQVLAILGFIYSFIPFRVDADMPTGAQPERESLLYVLFLLITACLAIFLFQVMKRRIQDDAFRRSCWMYVAVQGLWLLFMLFLFFKWVTYTYPFYNILPIENGGWVTPCFYGALIGTLLSKIFWIEIKHVLQLIILKWHNFAFPKRWTWVVYVLVSLGVMFLLWPQTKIALVMVARMVGFASWDQCPPLKFLLSRGFTSEFFIQGMVLAHVLIFTGIFMIVHRWLKSFWLAGLVILLGIKMTLFHYGMAPIPWAYPQATLLNPTFDLTFFKDAAHQPMFMSLRVRQFFSFFMGFVLPIFYIGTLLFVWGKNRVVAAISIWGLLSFTRYLALPNVFAYGAVTLPALLLLVFWLDVLLKAFIPRYRRMICAGLVALALLALLTNRVFVTYPHIWGSYVRIAKLPI